MLLYFWLSLKINFYSAKYCTYDILQTWFIPVVRYLMFLSQNIKCLLEKLKPEYVHILTAAKS